MGEGYFPAPERAAFPSMYWGIWPDMIPIARDLGYALAIHGSLSRDLDVIAIPWTDEAVDAETLVEAIRAKFDCWIGTGVTRKSDGGEAKPHGRKAWSLHLGGHAFIDLSVMPRQEQPR